MAKRGTGKGNLPTGKLFSASYVTALSLHGSSCADHRHCPDDSGSSAHAVASQHRQAATRLCQGESTEMKTSGRQNRWETVHTAKLWRSASQMTVEWWELKASFGGISWCA